MMAIVHFDQVSKQFTLRHQRPRSFQDLFFNLFHRSSIPPKELYNVLREVSFDVERGEMLGIVGDNGVGKSTVLKLITRIIEPTMGRIEVNGRVSALLELGAGFHPELTGRENVYLNGSILGFSRAEMNHIFDDIVSFAEMEHFIDIPVKHYSSGMYMRLGFSIAVHVQPDILLVDEVLAVGDQAFQKQCLQRIEEIRRRGVTIILVTHDLETARTMCDRAIWLADGRIRADGNVRQVIDAYSSGAPADSRDSENEGESSAGGGIVSQRVDAPWRLGSHEAEIIQVQFLDSFGRERKTFDCGGDLTVRMHFDAHERIRQPQFGLALHNASGLHINGPNTSLSGFQIDAIEGCGHVDYVVDSLPLLEGAYTLTVSLYDHDGVHVYDLHDQAYTFRVRRSRATSEAYGTILIPSRWEMVMKADSVD